MESLLHNLDSRSSLHHGRVNHNLPVIQGARSIYLNTLIMFYNLAFPDRESKFLCLCGTVSLLSLASWCILLLSSQENQVPVRIPETPSELQNINTSLDNDNIFVESFGMQVKS